MIEHDPIAEKFTDGESFLAYTRMNDYIDLYLLFAENEKVGEDLALAAFEYAKGNDLKIISSAEQIDTFIQNHPEFSNLIKSDFFA